MAGLARKDDWLETLNLAFIEVARNRQFLAKTVSICLADVREQPYYRKYAAFIRRDLSRRPRETG